MDETSLASRKVLCVFSWWHVFYSSFYMSGDGSLVIESEMEKKGRKRGWGYEDGAG